MLCSSTPIEAHQAADAKERVKVTMAKTFKRDSDGCGAAFCNRASQARHKDHSWVPKASWVSVQHRASAKPLKILASYGCQQGQMLGAYKPRACHHDLTQTKVFLSNALRDHFNSCTGSEAVPKKALDAGSAKDS
jgi:hypothetical protein